MNKHVFDMKQWSDLLRRDKEFKRRFKPTINFVKPVSPGIWVSVVKNPVNLKIKSFEIWKVLQVRLLFTLALAPVPCELVVQNLGRLVKMNEQFVVINEYC